MRARPRRGTSAGPSPCSSTWRTAACCPGGCSTSGCGTGEHALLAAARGADAVGVDLSPLAIEIARRKAAERGLAARFEVADALNLGSLGLTFDTIIDSGVFHVFDDSQRARYVTSLGSVLRPGGSCYLMCFSDRQPGDWGPRRVRARRTAWPRSATAGSSPASTRPSSSSTPGWIWRPPRPGWRPSAGSRAPSRPVRSLVHEARSAWAVPREVVSRPQGGIPMATEPQPADPRTSDAGRPAGPPGQPAPLPQHVVKRTRMGNVWFAAASFAVVLLLLLIFILENNHSVDVAFFGAHGHLPLGVALAAGRRPRRAPGGDPRHGQDHPAAPDRPSALPR